jgi:cold shock CspA family protein
MNGTVTTLTDRGFGFIRAKDARDLFFHSKDLSGVTFDELRVGDAVSFDVRAWGEKGDFAAQVNRDWDNRDEQPREAGEWDEQSREAQKQDEQSREVRERFADQDMIALAVVDDQISVLGLTRDGTCQFVDANLNVHSLLYVGSETVELKHAIEEFENLLNQAKVPEKVFQDFFERHPEFLLTEEHYAAHPHVVLEGDRHKGRLIPDFILEPLKQGALSDILEVKLPSAPLYVQKANRARFSSAVFEACAQLREYSAFFDRSENRERIALAYNGLQLYRPNLFLIIGRTSGICPVVERRIQSDIGLPLHLRTYDDVMLRMRERVRRQERSGGSGSAG